MKRLSLIFTVFILLFAPVFCVVADQVENKAQIAQNIKNYIKTDNKTALANIVKYPLKRTDPIPYIKNATEFVEYYNFLFDDEFSEKILKSNPDTDWHTVGWRGITFGQGDIWFDYDGGLTAINHVTAKEKEYAEKLTAQNKAYIYPKLKEYARNELLLKTEKFIIRIDLLDDQKYRYATWGKNQKMNEKPNLIIKNGMMEYDGNGGNRHFDFQNGKYKYIINDNRIGTAETVPYTLSVYENDNLILYQSAEIMDQLP